MALQKTHTVYPLMGNVELWRLETLLTDDPARWRPVYFFSPNFTNA